MGVDENLRFNVEYKGKYSCYTTVADGFLEEFMELKEYEEWRTKEYGEDKEPLETANRWSIHECIDYLYDCRGRKATLEEVMYYLDLNKKQAKNLIKRSRKKMMRNII